MADLITIDRARDLFNAGSLAGFEIYCVPMNLDSWQLLILLSNGGSRLLGTSRGDLRVFKSLDTVHKAITEIGYPVRCLIVRV